MRRFTLVVALIFTACAKDTPPPAPAPPARTAPEVTPPPPPPPPPKPEPEPDPEPPTAGTFHYAPDGATVYDDEKLAASTGVIAENGIVLVTETRDDGQQVWRTGGQIGWVETSALRDLVTPAWIRGVDPLPEVVDCAFEPPEWLRVASAEGGRLHVEVVAKCDGALTVHTVPFFPDMARVRPERRSSCERPIEEMKIANQSPLTFARVWPEHYAQCDRMELRDVEWSPELLWVSYPTVTIGTRKKKGTSGYLVKKTFLRVERPLDHAHAEIERGVFVAAGIGEVEPKTHELVVYRITTSPPSRRRIHAVRWTDDSDDERWSMNEAPNLTGSRGSKCTYSERKKKYGCELATPE